MEQQYNKRFNIYRFKKDKKVRTTILLNIIIFNRWKKLFRKNFNDLQFHILTMTKPQIYNRPSFLERSGETNLTDYINNYMLKQILNPFFSFKDEKRGIIKELEKEREKNKIIKEYRFYKLELLHSNIFKYKWKTPE